MANRPIGLADKSFAEDNITIQMCRWHSTLTQTAAKDFEQHCAKRNCCLWLLTSIYIHRQRSCVNLVLFFVWRLSPAVAVISHAFKSNHNLIRMEFIKGKYFLWQAYYFCLCFLYLISIFYLYCNTFDGSSIIIFNIHAIELFFHHI